MSVATTGSLGIFENLELLDLSNADVENYYENYWHIEENLQTAFSQMENLKWLNLSCFIRDGGFCLEGVRREKVEFLDISYCCFSDYGLWALVSEEWPVLKKLVADCITIYGPLEEDDESVSFLSLLIPKMRNLVCLSLSNMAEQFYPIKDLELVVHLSNLQELRVDCHNAEVFKYLDTLVSDHPDQAGQLEVLQLGSFSLDAETLVLISKLHGLKELRLDGAGTVVIGTEVMWKISRGCRKLEKVDLCSYIKLADTCLASIGAYCPNLSHINCGGSQEITNQGVLALVEGLKSSGEREKGRKVQILVGGCRNIDVSSLHITESWIKVSELYE